VIASEPLVQAEIVVVARPDHPMCAAPMGLRELSVGRVAPNFEGLIGDR
jgi:hypothetical protein